MTKKKIKQQFHEFLNKLQWEGGIEGILDYGHSDLTKFDKELNELFNKYNQLNLDIEKRIAELTEEHGILQYE